MKHRSDKKEDRINVNDGLVGTVKIEIDLRKDTLLRPYSSWIY